MALRFIDVALAAWPELTEEQANDVLIERTPFPFKTDPRTLYKCVSGSRRAAANGRRLCEWCHREVQHEQWTCAICEAALTQAKE